ncbi:hypothetical protein TTHERM_00389790 (macronuclear) [Tetrahymena thermophila SB210]|uniref:Uncharacterized protein n=1 Tax=Tetrahymena thermophila (strain SB210) TaxID=312017 RepID=Q23RA9_TETTS|nr:hypothetical protein TTHERM_00389790 [Tetrahymena thermophila SB210]EAR99139.2 hypothetical protein TTHERM_00389790 [Tetrahymena thermophila SB210]|eukprot:XP_001019384.2 hypothetical protein TTHERM_00389790 [Tetrahymena thermophila SB210]
MAQKPIKKKQIAKPKQVKGGKQQQQGFRKAQPVAPNTQKLTVKEQKKRQGTHKVKSMIRQANEDRFINRLLEKQERLHILKSSDVLQKEQKQKKKEEGK